MADEFPTEFDVVVIGTGNEDCCIFCRILMEKIVILLFILNFLSIQSTVSTVEATTDKNIVA